MSVHQTRTGKHEVRYREAGRNKSKTFLKEQDASAFDQTMKEIQEAGRARRAIEEAMYGAGNAAVIAAERERYKAAQEALDELDSGLVAVHPEVLAELREALDAAITLQEDADWIRTGVAPAWAEDDDDAPDEAPTWDVAVGTFFESFPLDELGAILDPA